MSKNKNQSDNSMIWNGTGGSPCRNQVGGKAYNLGHLNAVPGIRVPRWICLTTEFFYEFLGDHRLEYEELLDNYQETSREKILSLLEQCRFSDAQKKLLRDTMAQNLDGAEKVAVRSSAVDEDSADQSFAGMMESTLNVSTEGEIEKAICDCYRSCFSPRIMAYRQQHGLINREIAAAVIIQEMVDDFEMQTSGEIPVLGYTEDNQQILNPLATDYDPTHPWDGREERFYSCILYNGATLQGRQIDISANGKDDINIGSIIRTNYFTNKYLDQNHNLVTHASWTYRRFAIMRTGELYLNYAEALNEVEGPTARVRELVNVIRRRAKVKEIPDGLTKDQMRERIRHERRIELCFENHRFWDVRRWKIAEVVDNKTVHRVTVDADGVIHYPVFQHRVFVAPKHYLFPIPQSEIDKNRELEQNPEW